MSFFYSCLFVLMHATLALASVTCFSAEVAAPEPPTAMSAYGSVAASDNSSESLARLMLTTLLASDKTAGETDPDSREDGESESNDADQEEATIPGAFVAVIFGVFGLLVIARRSQR